MLLAISVCCPQLPAAAALHTNDDRRHVRHWLKRLTTRFPCGHIGTRGRWSHKPDQRSRASPSRTTATSRSIVTGGQRHHHDCQTSHVPPYGAPTSGVRWSGCTPRLHHSLSDRVAATNCPNEECPPSQRPSIKCASSSRHKSRSQTPSRPPHTRADLREPRRV